MHHLTERYFENQCSDEALEQVLTWFKTTEGQAFLSKQIKEDYNRLIEEGQLPAADKKIPTELIYNRIQESKDHPSRTHWILMWLTPVLLVAAVFSVHYPKSL